jgi:hypothetical protein
MMAGRRKRNWARKLRNLKPSRPSTRFINANPFVSVLSDVQKFETTTLAKLSFRLASFFADIVTDAEAVCVPEGVPAPENACVIKAAVDVVIVSISDVEGVTS